MWLFGKTVLTFTSADFSVLCSQTLSVFEQWTSRDLEAAQMEMLGTEWLSHSFEKQGQFGLDNSAVVRWGIQKWSVPKSNEIFNHALEIFFFF